ncbi:MAG: hypothetical protein ABSG05_00570 [Candidatus Pacearchaeota archaeon]|jgi:hypothetical protein
MSREPVNIEKPKYLPITKKAILFDSGPIISFAMNGMTGVFRELKKIFRGKFIITNEVKSEVIDVPLRIKRFELEALMIKRLLDEGVFELPTSLDVKDSEIEKIDQEFLNTANSTFNGDGKDIHILDHGESSCLALSKILNEKGVKNIIAIDERTTRLLVEKPDNLKELFEERFHTKIKMDSEKTKMFTNFKIIRSPELAYVAYKNNLLGIKDGKTILDAVLYSMKFKGASISGEEIEQIKSIG